MSQGACSFTADNAWLMIGLERGAAGIAAGGGARQGGVGSDDGAASTSLYCTFCGGCGSKRGCGV